MKPVIRLEHIEKVFTDGKEDFEALRDVSLEVNEGDIFGIIGLSGAGKSTLVRCINLLERPTSGEVLVDGAPVFENPAAKARIASIPDDWYYFLQSDVRDMMRFYRGFYPNFNQARYEKFKEIFEIDEKRSIRRLSKGMQKQVAFWLAMCTMPDYLVLDEPVDGLDPVMRRQVWSLMMGDVAERGTTVLVSSHNLRELEDVCDHVGIMDRGHVLLERSLAQLQDNMVKMQVVFQDGVNEVPADLPVLHASKIGRVHTLIMRMNAQEATERLMAYNPLLADAGCRNTLFNGRAQTGAGFLRGFRRLGLSRFRLELLDDPPEKIRLLVSRYRELLDGSCTAARLIRELDVAEQLGTTEGTLRPR